MAAGGGSALVASLNLARIPAGAFMMGASDAAADERPVHRVYVSEFFIGRTVVTLDEYAKFVRTTGHPPPAVRTLPAIAQGTRDHLFREAAAPYLWHDGHPPPGRQGHPVVLVQYDDASAYCRWLSDVFGREVRLPTEAEWEKAARGGIDGLRYPWGAEIDPSACNVLADRVMKREGGTRSTGTYSPNAYGLYDMIGNVWEWVSDWYGADYYASCDVQDPKGPASGTMRVVRGGAWVNADANMLTCAYRHSVPPDTYSYSIGFRIVCSNA